MCSEEMLRHLATLGVDPRFGSVSTLDLQNILTAIDLCGIGFNHGKMVAEDLNLLLAAEWPTGHGQMSFAT